MKKAIVLLSGGLDSTVVLALALAQGRTCYALSFNYGQRHLVELEAAQAVAEHYQVPHTIIQINPAVFAPSSLISHSSLQVPSAGSVAKIAEQGIPNTYVPARNTLFLSYALGLLEMHQAEEIHFGPNKTDQCGYPDCRPAYLQAFQNLLNVATKQGIEGRAPQLITPLKEWDKSEVIKCGLALQAPLHLTMSCYNPLGWQQPCQQCDACLLRTEGFQKVQCI